MNTPYERLSIIEVLQATSVEIGELVVPGSKVEEAIGRYCKHTIVFTGVEEFPYSFFGSGTALRYRGRHLLIRCGHQVDHVAQDDVGFAHYATGQIITAGRVIWPTKVGDNADTDYIDMRAFEYDVNAYAIPSLSFEFFPLNEANIWPVDANPGRLILFGYPTEFQDIDYSLPHITQSKSFVQADYDGPTSSPYMHRATMRRKRQFDSDGMSGGSVFYVGRRSTDGRYFMGFAGVIVRGGPRTDHVHFIDANFIIKLFA